MNVTRDEWDKEEAGVWVLNWVVRRLPQYISVCNMQWECQEWVFSPVIGSPVTMSAAFSDA